MGQSAFEEIDIILKGKNYGWNVKEGLACYSRSPCDDGEEPLSPTIVTKSIGTDFVKPIGFVHVCHISHNPTAK